EAKTVTTQNRLRRVPIEAPRGDIVDRNNVKLVQTKQAAVVQLVPSTLPQVVRDDADKYRQELAAAEAERLRAQDSYDALSRQLRDDGRKSTKEEKAERRRLKHASEKARKVPIPPAPVTQPALLELYRRISEVIKVSPKTIHAPRTSPSAPTYRCSSSTTCASGRSTSRASSSPTATSAAIPRARRPRS